MTPPAENSSALLEELAALPAAERLPRLRREGDLGPALQDLAQAAERLANDDVRQGLDACALVQELADEADEPAAQAKARTAHGQVLCHAGRLDEAIAVLEQGLGIAEAAGNDREAAWCRMVLVHPLTQQGRYEEATRQGEAARTALLQLDDQIAAAGVDISLGATQRVAGRPEQALHHYDRARPLLAGDDLRLARLDANRGNAFYSLHDFAAAEEAYEQALAAFEKLDLGWAVAVVHENIGDMLSRQGQLSRAMSHFEQARRRLERDEAPADLARLQMELAEAQAALGLTQEAIESLRSALPELTRHGLRYEAARAREVLGVALSQARQLKDADEELSTAARELRDLGNESAAARAEVLRAQVLAARGKQDEALALVERALPALSDRPADEAIAQYHLASWRFERGERQAAEALLAKALATAESLHVAPLVADLLHLRSRFAAVTGDQDAALTDLRAALEQIERVRSTLQADRFRAAFLGNRLRIYEDLVAALVARGESEALAEAFNVAEQAKSRSLLDLVRGGLDAAQSQAGQAEDADQAALLVDLARLRREINAIYSELDDEQGPAGQRSQRDLWRRRLNEHERRLLNLELRLASRRSSAPFDARPADLDRLRGALDENTTLLEYYVMAGTFIAFVLRPGQPVRCLRLARVDEIAEAVRRLHFQINRAIRPLGARRVGRRWERSAADADRELGLLYELLFEPLEAHIGDAEHLVFVPHDSLHSLPLHALWDGSQHLFERYSITCAPSGSLHAHMMERGKARRGRLRDNGKEAAAIGGAEPRSLAASGALPTNGRRSLILGVPDAAAPRIADEVARVASLFPEAMTLRNGTATAASFAARAAEADFIHVACHGRFLPHSPLSSGLRLTDRWLTARDVLEMRLDADLVVLSGCDTGRNLIGAGDELHGLLRGFLAAGAASLITSLWTVDDETAASLIARFYESWQPTSGRLGAKASALRQAWLQTHAEEPHPAHWAPFTIIGAP